MAIIKENSQELSYFLKEPKRIYARRYHDAISSKKRVLRIVGILGKNKVL